MTVDRRVHDPFAPHPVAALTGVVTPEPADLEATPDGDGLDDMRRIDLVELAVSRGVPGYGTKADLVKRLRSSAS